LDSRNQQDIADLAREYRSRISSAFVIHPKVALQGLGQDEASKAQLVDAIPDLLPFKGRDYYGFLPVIDWDHRLPSKDMILRVYAYYTKDSLAVGEADLDVRLDEIRQLDQFPEFDVPDCSGIVADEAYDFVVSRVGVLTSSRLTSAWRRDLDPRDAARAAAVVRRSSQMAGLRENTKHRPPNLGEAEAVSWTPPCESGYHRWTVDVWFLVSYDGMFGKGKSFLVDIDTRRVVVVREFTVRPD